MPIAMMSDEQLLYTSKNVSIDVEDEIISIANQSGQLTNSTKFPNHDLHEKKLFSMSV